MTKEEAIHHWLYKGRYESRIYNPKNFCWNSYVKINKDFKDLCKEEAIYHWLYKGINENRIYCPLNFDYKEYVGNNDDLKIWHGPCGRCLDSASILLSRN